MDVWLETIQGATVRASAHDDTLNDNLKICSKRPKITTAIHLGS